MIPVALLVDWARYDAQTTYIVRRYRNNPVILAWDLRNEGDLDWGADGRAPVATQEQVMSWLAHTILPSLDGGSRPGGTHR